METLKFREGSVIQYRDFAGKTRTVKVETRDAEIKNGRPGFDGIDLNEKDPEWAGCWGYDAQVIGVVRY